MKTHSTQTDTANPWLSSVKAFVLTMILTCCFGLVSTASTNAEFEVEVSSSIEEAELPSCEDFRVRNQGSCRIFIYEWLDNGDILRATLDPGEQFNTTACDGTHWRATNLNGNFSQIIYDENFTFSDNGPFTWTLTPDFCDLSLIHI